MDSLTAKEIVFVKAIVTGASNHDAYVAAYKTVNMQPASIDSRASEVIARPRVSLYIAELRKQSEQTSLVTRERVLSEVAKIAFTDLPGIVNFDGVTMTLTQFESLSPQQRACIKKFICKRVVRDESIEDFVTVELHDKLAALEKLMKHLGMYEQDNKQQNAGNALAELLAEIDGQTRGLPGREGREGRSS